MKEIEDNQVKNIFGRLSDKEAEINPSSWNKVSRQLPRSANTFWHAGLQHFNIFYAISAVVILIVGGIAVQNQTETIVQPSKAIPDSSDKANQQFFYDYEKTDSINSYEYHKRTPVVPSSPSVDPGESVDKGMNVAMSDSSHRSLDIYGKKKKEDDVRGVNQKSDSIPDYPAIMGSFAESEIILKDSLKIKAPTSKKIIIFEEDTIIKIDTIYKSFRNKRGKS